MINPQVQQADYLRPLRAFITGAYGMPEQTMAGQDGIAQNVPLRYEVIGPNGEVAQQGAPVSNQQGVALFRSPVVLLLGAAVVAFFVLRK